MTGPELKAWRTARGWTQPRAAVELAVPIGTLRNWEQNQRRIPSIVDRLLALLEAA